MIGTKKPGGGEKPRGSEDKLRGAGVVQALREAGEEPSEAALERSLGSSYAAYKAARA